MFEKPHFWGLVIAGAVLLFAIAFYATEPPEQEPAGTEAFRPMPQDAVNLAPGIDYTVLTAGDGEPVDSEYIRFDMDMYTANGQQVMSSEQDGSYSFKLETFDNMSPGLATVLRATPAGETRRYWIEAEQLRPGYPQMPDMLHVIDITMLGGQAPLPAPDNVAAIPEGATVTDSGLAYTVLEEGESGDDAAHPSLADIVTVHYSGWTTDGSMFDSSVMRGSPAEFPLSRLIAGWQEGIPLMTRGAKYRFWIPAELAYANSDRPDAPQGMLVFDIELLDFTTPAAAQPTDNDPAGE